MGYFTSLLRGKVLVRFY